MLNRQGEPAVSRTPGRPEVGPKVELRLPSDALAAVDADANRQRISRAQWLRDAVQEVLPYETLDSAGRAPLADVLAGMDAGSELRDWALAPEAPKAERIVAAERYASTWQEMRTLIGQLRDVLPLHDAQDAYRQASAADPKMTSTQTAQAWGRATAVEHLAGLLSAVSALLPSDEDRIRFRAALDDPHENLDAG